jgi:hypothetical protein
MLSHESLKKDECRKLKSLLLNQLPFFSLTMEMHGTQTAQIQANERLEERR